MIDQAIIQGCIKEDTKSQKVLFEALAPKMFSICMRYARHRMEAEDMLQDAFVRIFDNIQKYNGSGSFDGWVRKIVVNTALSYCKKISFSKEEIGISNTFEQGFLPKIIEELSEQELLLHIAKLPDGYRIIFNLFAIEGYDHKEISELLHIKESTSRSQLTRARHLLQTKIIAAAPEFAFYLEPKKH